MPKYPKFVAPVSESDRAIVEALCREPTAPYSCGNNWLYYQCLCRDKSDWLRYWDGDTFIFITPHPSKMGAYAFVRPLGASIIETVAKLARIYIQKTEQPVVVKNISPEQFQSLKAYGFSDYEPDDGWNMKFGYRYDEEQHEEVIVSILPFLIDECSKKYKTNTNPDADIELLVEQLNVNTHRKEMQHILERWVEFYTVRNVKETKEHLSGVYNSFIYELSNRGWIFKVDRQVVGFIVAAPGLPYTLDFYAALYDPAFRSRGISSQMYKIAFQLAAERGYTFVGLGGSETDSLHTFKRRFKPHRLIKRTHAVLYPKMKVYNSSAAEVSA